MRRARFPHPPQKQTNVDAPACQPQIAPQADNRSLRAWPSRAVVGAPARRAPPRAAELCRSFARLGYKSDSLVPAVGTALTERGLIEATKPVEVADLSYAVAMLGDAEGDAALLSTLAARASPVRMARGPNPRGR